MIASLKVYGNARVKRAVSGAAPRTGLGVFAILFYFILPKPAHYTACFVKRYSKFKPIILKFQFTGSKPRALPEPAREQASRRSIGPMGLYPLYFLFHPSCEIKNI
jgi:hypothetical protein